MEKLESFVTNNFLKVCVLSLLLVCILYIVNNKGNTEMILEKYELLVSKSKELKKSEIALENDLQKFVSKDNLIGQKVQEFKNIIDTNSELTILGISDDDESIFLRKRMEELLLELKNHLTNTKIAVVVNYNDGTNLEGIRKYKLILNSIAFSNPTILIMSGKSRILQMFEINESADISNREIMKNSIVNLINN